MKIIIETEKDNKKAIQLLKDMGDLKTFKNSDNIFNFFEKLVDLIEDFKKEHYSI